MSSRSKKLINQPQNIVAEMLEGYVAANPDILALTAERLVVELKSKVGAGDASTPITGESETAAPTGGTMQRDAVAALIALGYRAVDADQAVRNASLALGPKATTEALIKKALS